MKQFTYKGKLLEELKRLDIKELAKLLPARQRRSLVRGFNEQQKIFLERVKNTKDTIKTHLRDMIVLPEMVGKTILVHNGKEWTRVFIIEEMIGHYLGEFTLTRKKVQHSAPGIGATRSSAGQAKAK